jgi:hypothetical protein
MNRHTAWFLAKLALPFAVTVALFLFLAYRINALLGFMALLLGTYASGYLGYREVVKEILRHADREMQRR